MLNWLNAYEKGFIHRNVYIYDIYVLKFDSILFFDVCLNSSCLQVTVIVLPDTSHEHSLKVKY